MIAAKLSWNQPSRVALAAGGTGGHMFPAQALARELIGRGIKVTLITDKRGAGFGPDLPQVETYRVSAGGLAGGNAARKLRAMLSLGWGCLQARSLLKSLDAEVVVGFGGYASVPAVLAARWLGQRIVLHEQNAVLGRANRLLAHYSDTICTSFHEVDGVQPRDLGKIVLTGNPVRAAIAGLAGRHYSVPGEGERFRILVLGGSLGARVFNSLVPAAIAKLPESLRQRLSVSQQVRGNEETEVAAAYRTAGVRAELASFFDDVPQRLGAAQLVICRAGASTIAELAAAGRPALLVPYPFATDDHQTANAKAFADAGGGWLMPQSTLDAEKLAVQLQTLLSRPADLTRAARAALGFAQPHAALNLADVVCGGGDKGSGESAKDERGARAA